MSPGDSPEFATSGILDLEPEQVREAPTDSVGSILNGRNTDATLEVSLMPDTKERIGGEKDR